MLSIDWVSTNNDFVIILGEKKLFQYFLFLMAIFLTLLLATILLSVLFPHVMLCSALVEFLQKPLCLSKSGIHGLGLLTKLY